MPTPAVGAQSVLGVSPFEATFGAATTVDRFYEFTGETIGRANRVMQSQGLRASYLPRGSRRVLTGHDAAGDLRLEVATTGFSRIFQWILGGTPTIAQQGGTTAYLHTHTMGSLLGRSVNVQKQLKDGAGTAVKTFTYRGTKVNSATFDIAVDGILNLNLGLDVREESDDVAAAAASYGSANLFHFQQATLSVAGAAAADVSSASITIANSLKTDRRHLGNAGLKSEQVDDNFRAITGTFNAEVTDGTYYDLFELDTAAALVLEFTGNVISGAFSQKLTITVPEVHLTGATPSVGGPETVVVDVPFEAAFTGSGSPITIAYTSTDTAV